ncbi:hypothetical protein GEMRC1_013142 [Eukaryota sp. GEM-RC1]
MRLLLLSCLVLLVLGNHQRLESNIAVESEFPLGRKPMFFYTDTHFDEETIIWTERISCFLNGTFSGIDLVTIPHSPKGHGRLFISVVSNVEIYVESSNSFNITAISAVPLRSGRPTTLRSSTASTSYYFIPICSTDDISLKISVNSGTVTKVHYSQDNGRPTTSDPSKEVSGKEFTTSIRLTKQSPLFFAVHVSGSTNFSITASIPSKVVKEFDLLIGELSRGCYAHFELQVKNDSNLPLSAIYSNHWRLDSSFVYVSFNKENPQPDAIEYDDVSYLEMGGIISIPSPFSDVDKVFIGVAPTITMPNHLVRFAFHLTQTHHVVLPGFITYLPVDESSDKPTYFVLSPEIRIQAVAVGVQVLLPPVNFLD